MPLPKIETPKYRLTIPSTSKTIEYRPYLVKEEKILMLALEAESSTEMIAAIRDVVRSCTFDKVNVDALCLFDLEYLFLKLRAKSVGETAKVRVNCKYCNRPHDVELNLDTIKVDVPKIDKKIMLTDTIGVTMRYPTVNDLLVGDLVSTKSIADASTSLLYCCVETIFDKDSVHRVCESSREEFEEFIDSLSQKQLEKIKVWLDSTPTLKHTVKFKCANPECSRDNEVTLAGLQSFFT